MGYPFPFHTLMPDRWSVFHVWSRRVLQLLRALAAGQVDVPHVERVLRDVLDRAAVADAAAAVPGTSRPLAPAATAAPAAVLRTARWDSGRPAMRDPLEWDGRGGRDGTRPHPTR